MESKQQKQIVESYVKAYNAFDIDSMLENMDESIKFENISDGKSNLTLNGIDAFRDLALEAQEMFKQRKQEITSFSFDNNNVEIAVDYFGILSIDLPNGLKAGSNIELKGKSVFKFRDDKIVALTDIS